MNHRELARLTWPEAGDLAADGAALALPLGSTEQHGPHLPLSTDADLAHELCRRLAAARRDVVVAPPLAYGASGEHEGFVGTLSIGQEALEATLVELCRSASRSFPGVVIVSTHGGNAEPLRRAERRLTAESRRILAWAPSWSGDAHAGRTETSIQLALDPDSVRLERAEAGDRRPIRELMPELRASSVRAVSANGVLGDPEGASAVEGIALIEAMFDELASAFAAWRAGWRATLPGAGAEASR